MTLDLTEAACDWLFPTRRIGDCLLINGDCAEVLAAMDEASIDSVVTDPPYGLSEAPDMAAVLEAWISGDDYRHGSKGFMGNEWDSFVPGPALWSEVVRTMKPGAHVLSFAGSRTYDLTAVATRLAGLEIRDQVLYLFGTGFPKSLDVSKAIDKAAGVVFSAKPAEGVGFMRPDGAGGYNATNNQLTRAGESTDDAKRWAGYGTAMKPAHEPCVLARKPFPNTVASNVLTHGTGALNIDGCRVGDEVLPAMRAGNARLGTFERDDMVTPERTGRWPANVIHDGSDAVLAGFPADSGRFFYTSKPSPGERDIGLAHMPETEWTQYQTGNGTSGKASSLSADRDTKRRNIHPTVKPIQLMRYLIRLITQPGGIVLDPFVGSGTTGMAAVLEGRPFVGIERDPAYFEIACARIAAVVADPAGIAAQLEKGKKK